MHFSHPPFTLIGRSAHFTCLFILFSFNLIFLSAATLLLTSLALLYATCESLFFALSCGRWVNLARCMLRLLSQQDLITFVLPSNLVEFLFSCTRSMRKKRKQAKKFNTALPTNEILE